MDPDRNAQSGIVGQAVFVLACALAMACYVILTSWAADTFFQVVEWASIAVLVRGVRRNDRLTLPWVFIIVGWTSFALGDLLFSLYDHVFDIAPFPSVADVFYLAGYPFIAAGLAALVRRSRPDGDRIALIDAAIVLVPAAVAMWIYLIEPNASGGGSPLLERAVSAAYPIGDLLCLAVLIRLFAGPSRMRRAAQPAMGLLGFGMLVMLAADVWFVATQLHGGYVPGGWSDAMYLVPYLCVARAACSPSLRHIGDSLPESDPALGRRRLVLLATAALFTPVILMVEWLTSDDLAVPLIVLGTALSFVLVIMRMSAVVDALEGSRVALAHDATHDHLTGLANRGLLELGIDSMLARRAAGSLLFVDLDNFKRVNDLCGHRAGDEMLIRVAGRLSGAVRSDDVVARLAGDEFGVLLPGAGCEVASALAAHLVERLAISTTHDRSVAITASIGTVTWTETTAFATALEVLAEADRAMYAAKAGDGNQHMSANV